jgi:hypothetical protein
VTVTETQAWVLIVEVGLIALAAIVPIVRR